MYDLLGHEVCGNLLRQQWKTNDGPPAWHPHPEIHFVYFSFGLTLPFLHLRSPDPSSGPCIVEDPRGQMDDRGRQREGQDFRERSASGLRPLGNSGTLAPWRSLSDAVFGSCPQLCHEDNDGCYLTCIQDKKIIVSSLIIGHGY